MKEHEMEVIALLIGEVLKGNKTSGDIKSKIRTLRSSFDKLHYCFQE
ncbi:hypothetical protein QGM71_09825 [Virgibacillus sp. C22-A2]|uniref:Uncharacterized protein n=1 Tax=Virgibacillus tibetensis TaxID=3042313 RepID=A0ABU6KG02_9BACI|nr:hypothetical protein [Virgibacillus sp. C22-A2]